MTRKITLIGILAFTVPWGLLWSQPFWTEDFRSGLPANWETGDESPNGLLWEFCDNPALCPPATLPIGGSCRSVFASSSAENGFAFFNSFANLNISSNHKSYLRTPAVNCSDKAKVFLVFETFIAANIFDLDSRATVRVRSNNGAWDNYTVFPEMNFENFEPPISENPQTIFLDISASAANKTNVQIEWRWDSRREWSWCLDDVALFDHHPLHERIVWGGSTGQGDFEAGLNGWTVQTSPDDTCKWRWDEYGLIYFPQTQSPSADGIGCTGTLGKGVAMINPSVCEDAFFPYSESSLVSPVINLSNVTPGVRLGLQFIQSVAIGNPKHGTQPLTSVMISLDGGQTYIDTLDANPLLPYQTSACEKTLIPLPLLAAGSNSLRVKFVFAGSSFYWIIDEVSVVRYPDYELKISNDFYARSPDRLTPFSQVHPFGLIGDVENVGNQPVTNARLFAMIKDDASGQVVYLDSLLLGNLQAGESVENLYFGEPFSPAATQGNFTGSYRLVSDQTESDTFNNKVSWKFSVTENTFSKHKSRCDVNGYFRPPMAQPFEIGNCFFVANGKGFCASRTRFQFIHAAQPNDKRIGIRLYKWATETTNGDVNGDTLANENEYTELSYNQHIIQSGQNTDLITVPLDFEENCVPLEDSTWYFVTVAYEYEDPVFYIAASEVENYTGMFWVSYQFERPFYASMLKVGDETNFRANGWGLRRIPFIEMDIEAYVNTVQENEKAVTALQVFPNPASDILNLWTDLPLSQQNIRIEITDIWGRLVSARQTTQAFVSQLPIAVNDLSNGTYILRVITDEFAGAAQFAIFR
jgi:hypothetical protein